MRLAGRFIEGTGNVRHGFCFILLLTLSACSLPDITVEKKQARAEAAGAGFFTKGDDHTATAPKARDKTYLATVHIQWSETSRPVTFDIKRDRRDLISLNMMETKETATYLHLGYSHDGGGTAGLRFIWKF